MGAAGRRAWRAQAATSFSTSSALLFAAALAGVLPGDIVLSYNGTAVKSPEELRSLVTKGGKSAELLIQRDSQQLFVPVELG